MTVGKLLFGAHMPVAGGLASAVDEAVKLGINSFQIFSKNPRGWAAKPLDPQAVREFRDRRVKAGIEIVIVHTGYLINLASLEPAMREKSILSLSEELARARDLGADYLNTHIGSCKGCEAELGLRQVAASINEAFKMIKDAPMLLLENTARARPSIGGSFTDISAIIKLVKEKERMGVCLDTAHALAFGYDLITEKGLDGMLSEIDSTVGLKNLRAVHLNDSKKGKGSGLDRHEHLCRGELGKKNIKRILQEPRLKNLPFILETPKATMDDDARNLEILKRLWK